MLTKANPERRTDDPVEAWVLAQAPVAPRVNPDKHPPVAHEAMTLVVAVGVTPAHDPHPVGHGLQFGTLVMKVGAQTAQIVVL